MHSSCHGYGLCLHQDDTPPPHTHQQLQSLHSLMRRSLQFPYAHVVGAGTTDPLLLVSTTSASLYLVDHTQGLGFATVPFMLPGSNSVPKLERLAVVVGCVRVLRLRLCPYPHLTKPTPKHLVSVAWALQRGGGRRVACYSHQ